jgi:hypothetical protein
MAWDCPGCGDEANPGHVTVCPACGWVRREVDDIELPEMDCETSS